jgi:hypothetical protein
MPFFRKTIKWGGAAVTLLLVVVWIGSGWYWIEWLSRSWFAVYLARGQVHISHNMPTAAPIPWGFRADRTDFDLRWLPRWFHSTELEAWMLGLPLWVPVIVTAAITTVAWRREIVASRVARLNLCPKCNYDRAGIAKDAVCPECGCAGGSA